MRQGERVRTTDGRLGIVAGLDGDVAEVMFAEGEEWVNLVDLVPAQPGPIDQLVEHLVGSGADVDGGSGMWDNAQAFGLRLQAMFLRHAQRFDPKAGLTNARIEPKPHQVSIVRTVVQKRQARMILADEVGLGKTIEAGLILKELRARGLVERALIMCPASLQMQWQSELRTKFNENFEIIDGIAARHLGRGGSNPFAQRESVICSLPFASRDLRAEQIVEAGWDFVVIDEAHRVRRWLQSRNSPKTTKAYELAEMLEPHTPAFLMLTATPMQLDPYELYSLIQIVEPGIFRSYEEYSARRLELPRLNKLVQSLEDWAAISEGEDRDLVVSELQDLLGEDAPSASDLDDPETREEAINDLVDRHPLAGVMVRNRKSTIGGFMGREASQHGVSMKDEEKRLYADIETCLRTTYSWAVEDGRRKAIGFLMVLYFKMLASSPAALYKSFGGRLERLREQAAEPATNRSVSFDPEAIRDLGDEADYDHLLSAAVVERLEWEIAELERLHDRLADPPDSKSEEFLKTVDALRAAEPETKMVVFTGFKATQKYLADNLEDRGIRVSTFHGGMNMEEKERQIRQFRDSSNVLISTEAGGEGRNLQFASILINYDLPWNPMKVEQRIGRLDRIGQQHKVRILNLFRFETVEERVHEVLSNRIRLFEESIGSLEAILGDLEKEIEKIFLAGDDGDVERFTASVEEQVTRAREAERQMADFALDRSSFRQDQTNALLGREPMATPDQLQQFVQDVLEYNGGTLRDHVDDGGQVVQLSPGLAVNLGLSDNPIRGVFSPQAALEREDLDFFALGNRTVDSIVDYAGDSDSAAVTTYATVGGPSSPQLEIVYEFRSDGRNRRGEVVRHRVGESLEVTEDQLTQMPTIGELAQLDAPPWLRDAVQASQARMTERFRVFSAEVRIADEALRDQDLERNERITAYRRLRINDRITEHRTWIESVERSGTEGQRKILPARQGRLRKDEERLAAVDAESERQRQKILDQDSVPASSMWSAALVVGR